MKIRYFPWLRDKLGRDEEQIKLPPDVSTVGGLIDWLSQRGPDYASAFEFSEVILVAVNEQCVHEDAPVTDDDEVTFFPPIAGG